MFSLCPGPSRALDFENKNLKFQKLAMILRNSEILCCCFQAARPAHPKSYYSAVFREMGLCDFFDHKIHGNDEKTSESQNCYEKVGRFGVNQNTFSFWRRSDKSLALVLKWLELSITPLKLCFHRFFGDLAIIRISKFEIVIAVRILICRNWEHHILSVPLILQNKNLQNWNL